MVSVKTFSALLKVANPDVRGNATWVLVDAFPLLDPDFNTEEKDTLLQKQFDLLLVRATKG